MRILLTTKPNTYGIHQMLAQFWDFYTDYLFNLYNNSKINIIAL